MERFKNRGFVPAVTIVGLMMVARPGLAQDNGPGETSETKTEEIAACIENSAQVFANCVDEHAWYVAPLCAAQYTADVALCMPYGFVKDAINTVKKD